MSIRSLVTPEEFDPEALAAMVEAFDAALKALDDGGQPKIVLEVIAQRLDCLSIGFYSRCLPTI
jgi:hypothetical protein